MPRRRPLALNALLLVGLLGACVNWRSEPVAPEVFLASHPRMVRVVRGDGSRLIIHEPRIVGDSVVGSGATPTQHLAVALAEVTFVESSQTNVAGSIGLGIGVLLVLAAIVLVTIVVPSFGRGYN